MHLLSDHAKITRDPLKAGVINAFLETSDLMQVVPWETIDTLSIKVIRMKNLPTVGFRAIGGSYAESTGSFEQLDETVYPLGGDIDIDKVYLRDKKAVVNPREIQVEMKLKALMYKFNDHFVNGDQATTPDGFTGIKKRISNLPTSQTLSMGTNGVDVRASSGNMYTFLDKLRELVFRIKDADVLLCNDTSFLGISSVARRNGWLQTDRDMFDRTIHRLGEGGPRLINVGYTDEGEGTKIITDTETKGSSTDCTSIYALRLGKGDVGGKDFHGIQEYDLDVEDIGRLEAKPVYRVSVDWPLGLSLWDNHAIGRLDGIRWATV